MKNRSAKLTESIMYQARGSVLFLGQFNATHVHRNALPCIVFGLEKPVRYQGVKHSVEADAILVSPGVDHKIDYRNGRGAALYLEGSSLHADSKASSMGASPIDGPLSQYLRDHTNTWSGDATETLLGSIGATRFVLDDRLLGITDKIDADPMDRLSQEDAARLTRLERTTFLRRFKEATGMTFRAYKLWQATKKVVRGVEEGRSIESAALDCGFYDAPHFSRSFKKTFGLAPSHARGPSIRSGK